VFISEYLNLKPVQSSLHMGNEHIKHLEYELS